MVRSDGKVQPPRRGARSFAGAPTAVNGWRRDARAATSWVACNAIGSLRDRVVMHAFDESSTTGRHVQIESAVPRPAALPTGLAVGQLDAGAKDE